MQVQFASQQHGYHRDKRGFKSVEWLAARVKRGVPISGPHANSRRPEREPNDPLFREQWYIVCGTSCSLFPFAII